MIYILSESNDKLYYLETFGCAANKSDAERIRRILNDKDYLHTDIIENASLVIFNTCGVKDPTERKILKKLKKSEEEKRSTIITGCLPNISLKAIKKANPNFSAIVDTKSTHEIKNVIDRIVKGEKQIEVFATSNNAAFEKIDIFPLSYNPKIGILTINEGCDGNCTFCGTKLARGKTLSHSPAKLLKQTTMMLDNGCQEIWITSQDSGAYKFVVDDMVWEVPELIDAICNLPYRFRLRLGMINPDHVLRLQYHRKTNTLFDVIEKHSQIFQFLHIPIQSGNNRILELMKRRHTIEEFKQIILDIRARFPKMTISTDIIVGFPTETEKEFLETVDLIKWFRPPVLNVSRYGARPGTVASKMEGQIHERDSKERSRLIMKIWKPIASEENSKWLHWKGQVLVDEEGKKKNSDGLETVVGRNYAYKPIILKANETSVGNYVSVEITETRTHYLIGSISKDSIANINPNDLYILNN